MKKLILIPASIIFLTLILAVTKKVQVETITLDKAIKDKLISITFISNGNYSGKSIFCDIKNLKGKNYKISIPAGTYFKAPSATEQDLIVPQEEFITLKANEVKSQLLNGFCTNLSNHAPKKDGLFKLAISKLPKEMPQLVTFLKGKKYENHTLQDAIWAITNKSSVTNISGDDEKSITALRKELFKLTGQKETWYTSPQEITVNEDRSINTETASISGQLKYQTIKGATVYLEVFSPEGISKVKTGGRKTSISGELTYNFNVKVQGWTKGIYQVKVLENDKIIKAYDFKV